MSKVMHFLWGELVKSIAPTLFFFVIFETTVFIRSLMGAPAGVTITSTGAAILGALLVSKSILVADTLPPFQWFRRRLAVSVTWRAFLYMLVIVAFQVLEELIRRVVADGADAALGEVLREFAHTFGTPLFWGTHILLMVFLLVYSFGTATIEVMGRERFYATFFGTRPPGAKSSG